MHYEKQRTRGISFPLGGIGSGCIGLRGNGELADFEIFNRPAKNTRNGMTHFAVKASVDGRQEVRVLQGDTADRLTGEHHEGLYSGFGFGPGNDTMAGFPHFRDLHLDATFPIAELTFREEGFPATVRLLAFNPFIPHREDDSSLPAAFFEWEVENIAAKTVEYTLAFTVQNPAAVSRNTAFSEEGMHGILLENAQDTPDTVAYSELCLATDAKEARMQEYWYRGGWMDGVTTYWKNLSAAAPMPGRTYDTPGKQDHATLTVTFSLAARERRRVRFLLSWYVPNAYNHWSPKKDAEGRDLSWRNYYATLFSGAREVAGFGLSRFTSLLDATRAFRDALAGSSLSPAMRDAVSANLAVLKSPTVLRLEGGELWGFEGVGERVGSCYGSCQHVWNYAYALPYLFPRLERSLREVTMRYALEESGRSHFRVDLPLGVACITPHACLDGQMGEVIKCYREWKLSGDTAWLRAHADSIFSMLEFAFSEENPDGWDRDGDGILEGRQHHTLDMELFGPSSWLEGLYLLALDAGAWMADALGDGARAARYRALYRNGRAFLNTTLFNGEYFCQQIDLADRALVLRYGAENYWNAEAGEIKYQVAGGSVIDQMLADWHAALVGLPPVFDPDKKAKALDALYRYNFKPTMRTVTNMWRLFSLNDEAGTVICAYPEGCKTPAIPIPYCEETMTGFEYALAGLFLAEGRTAECERLVSAVRDRHDGEKRNPWNEFECGSNYARSMASFALLPLSAGMRFDMTRGYLGFAPKGEEGRYLVSVSDTWGEVFFTKEGCRLSLYGEPLTLASFSLPFSVRAAKADGRPLAFCTEGEEITFTATAAREWIFLRA